MSESNSYAGKTCPFCLSTLKPGVAVTVCPKCKIPHHSECWDENGGCTSLGCECSPSSVGGRPAASPIGSVLPSLGLERHRSGSHRVRPAFAVFGVIVAIALVAGACYYIYGVPFLRTADSVCRSAASADSEFLETLDSSSITGNDLLNSAGDAESELDEMCRRLRRAWAPPRYQAVAHDLLSALEAHRDFYRVLAEECDSDSPDSGAVEDSADDAMDRYAAVDGAFLSCDLPTKVLGAELSSVVASVEALSEAKVLGEQVEDYFAAVDEWWRVLTEARNSLSSLRKEMRLREVNYGDCATAMNAIRLRYALKADLESMDPPYPCYDLHEQLIDIMDDSILYAQLICTESEERLYGNYGLARLYADRAQEIGNDFASELNSVWQSLGEIKHEYDCDPMDLDLDR